jgi:hypothetical protein
MTSTPDRQYIDLIEKWMKRTATYSLSELKIAKGLSLYFDLSPEIVAPLMKRLIDNKMFYRSVHKNDYQQYARWSFRFVKKT